MKKHLSKFLLLSLICVYYSCPAQAQTTECCANPACKSRAGELATALGNSVKFLGTYPPDQPMDLVGKSKFIESLKVNKPKNYDQIVKTVKNIHAWIPHDDSRAVCLRHAYDGLTMDQLKWVGYFLTSLYSSSFHSPEFAKGFGLHFHTGLGVKSLFSSTEQFVSTNGILLSYTFTPKGEVTGGHLRLLIGPSIYYSQTKAYVMINPRVEFRISDLGNELTNIGCIKLIAQGSFQTKVQLAGLGLAAEISRFNVELTGDYNFSQHALVFQTGLMYSVFFKKNK
jgi:hypothetical protein